MNEYEIYALLFAEAVFILFVSKAIRSRKYVLLSGILTLPILVLTYYKVSQFAMTDTTKYLVKMIHFSYEDIESLYPDVFVQYLITLIVTRLSTVFSIKLFGVSSFLNLEHIVLVTHTTIAVCITFAIIYGIYKYLVGRMNLQTEKKKFLFWISCFYLLFIMPVFILELKVFNYDKYCVTLGLLSLVITLNSFEKKNHVMMAMAIVFAGMASVEKVMASPILLLVMCLFVISRVSGRKGLANLSISIILNTGLSILIYMGTQIGLHSFVDIFLGYDHELTISNVFYPLNSAVMSLVSNYDLNSGDLTALYILIANTILIMIGSVVVMGLQKIYCRKKAQIDKSISILNSCLIFFMIGMGIISTYFINTRIYPYIEFAANESRTTPNFDNWYYHFGSSSAFGQYFLFLLNNCGHILNAVTSMHLAILIAGSWLLFKYKVQSSLAACVNIILLGDLGILFLYSFAGIPSDAKYKTVYILILFLCFLIYLLEYLFDHYKLITQKSRKILLVVAALSLITFYELIVFSPIEMAFAPTWNLAYTFSYDYPVKGMLRIGEPFSWGIHNMLAGEKIKKIVDEEGGSYSNINIYSDYATIWLSNPGMNYYSIINWSEIEHFGEEDYYILSRFQLIRDEIPAFIYDMPPIDTVSMRGQPLAWIYKGSQIKEYYEREVLK